VSTIAAPSHSNVRPPLHGIKVCASSLLPSNLIRPDGSLPALLRLQWMRSLRLLCLACRPNPNDHDNPGATLDET